MFEEACLAPIEEDKDEIEYGYAKETIEIRESPHISFQSFLQLEKLVRHTIEVSKSRNLASVRIDPRNSLYCSDIMSAFDDFRNFFHLPRSIDTLYESCTKTNIRQDLRHLHCLSDELPS